MGTLMGTHIKRGRAFRRVAPRGFVLLACGEHYVRRVNTALTFLKRVTRNEIVVLRARALSPIEHDQVISCVPPAHFSDAQATVALKTNVHRLVRSDKREWCYLDSDVIVVDPEINRIFDHRKAEVAFASDHTDIDTQSKHIVRCECSRQRCEHLRREIEKQFEIRIDDGRWFPWNGGTFVFGPDSSDFLDCWHEYAAATLGLDFWCPRDQGALAAAVWKAGLQAAPMLPRRFNRIVDGMTGIDMDKRRRVFASQLKVDTSYRLPGNKSTRKDGPVCLHFINDTIGRVGWKNWDDVAALLRRPRSEAASTQSQPLTPDNRIVHGLWIGKYLSNLELLTLHSFIRHGHEFHLWLYDDLVTPLPPGVVIEDAAELLPKESIFTKKNLDAECGVGKGSYGPFSDLFRYKLLYEKGGYWVDMDITCLRPLDIRAPYLFRSHRIGVMGNLIKCPRHSAMMRRAYEETLARANRHAKWLYANRILTAQVRKSRLSRFIRHDICNEDSWTGAVQFMLDHDLQIPKAWYAIHWINEMNRTIRENRGKYLSEKFLFIPDKNNPKQGSLLARLYEEYGLSSSGERDMPVEVHHRTKWGRFPEEHINVLLPTLNTGGAERIVLDTAVSLAADQSAQVLIMDKAPSSFEVPRFGSGNVVVETMNGNDKKDKIRRVAARVRSSPNPCLFVHMGDAELLSGLHAAGVPTIPVVHNLHRSWQMPATAFNDGGVIFVVSVSESVAQELHGYGCKKRIVVIRHQVDRHLDKSSQLEARRQIRRQLGIPKDTVLIGMVGQFKQQKNYPRAVRILSNLRRYVDAKLLIVGGWNMVNASGNDSYAETIRVADGLGVRSQVITTGTVLDVERYLAAFDVFLNTSTSEGLSIAMLEAQRAGCRIVACDVGGAKEVDYELGDLLSPESSDDKFAQSILRCLKDESKSSVDHVVDSNLIPFLWSAIGNYGWRSGNGIKGSTEVYLVSGSSLRSDFSFLLNSDGVDRICVGTFGDPPFDCQEQLEGQGVTFRRLPVEASPIGQARAALRFIAECGASVVYFSGVDIEVRLLLAKVLAPAIAIVDMDSPAALYKSLELSPKLQHRVCMDSSAYYARLRANSSFDERLLTA